MTLPRQKRILLILTISVLIVIVGLHWIYCDIIFRNFHKIFATRITLLREYIKQSDDNENAENLPQDWSSSAYLVNTENCSIPKTPVMPSFFQKEWRVENLPECTYEIENFFLSDDEKSLTFSPRNPEDKCCIQEITGNKTTKNFSLTSCEPTDEETITVSNKEMFAVKCGTSTNFEATFPIKPAVRRKLDYWEDKYVENKPPNIMILGIDSVSRLHAHRSIPKTLKLLKEMNFLEFEGYHSNGASTLANFMPLLTGISLQESRKLCAPDWKSSFDDCPFIWKLFNDSNYVTSFVEDGEGSFNWGGQGGFRNPPTDYYIQPLFQALKYLRLKSFGKNATWWTREIFTDCVSSETVPQFLLRYTRRFIKKFWSTPFFSFTWLAYPFHEHMYSLAGIDDDLVEFFQGIRDDSPMLFEDTLIIVISDHGDRTSFFQSSIEGFIERSLPPLFLRIPDTFEDNFPHLAIHMNAMKNTRRLTTPWDIHHTILHTVSLFPSPTIELEQFSPVLKDRTSLLAPVPRDRSCETVNIPLKNCICDTVVNQVIDNAPILLKQIVKFINFELNEVVRNSKYSKVCHEWVAKVENVLSFRFLGVGTSQNSSEYLIVFSADPGDSRFEARLTATNHYHLPHKEYDINLIGQFTRINLYGNQSSCIKFRTDADKEMKEFCFCK